MKFGWSAAMLVFVIVLLHGQTVAAQSGEPTTVSAKNLRTLTIGRVSGNPRKHAARLLTFGQHIVDHHDSFDDVNVVLKHKVEELIAAASRGEIDIVSETLFGAMKIQSSGHMQMEMLEWKENVRAYRSLLLVRKDSALQKLEDLKGARVAFEDPGSTTGFFLPYVDIMEAGLKMVPDQSGAASSDDVRYLFGGAEINVVGSLVRGRVDAAAISNLDLDDDEVVTARFQDEIRVLHETRSVPRSITLMRTSLTSSDRERLKEILSDMHQHDAGQSVLRKYFKIKQFEVLDASIRDEFRWIRNAFNAHLAR